MSQKKKMLKFLFGKNKKQDNISIEDSQYIMIRNGRTFEEYIEHESITKEFSSFLYRPELYTIYENCIYIHDNVNRIQRERIF